MKSYRRGLSLLLCLLMLLSLFPAAFAEDDIELARDEALNLPGIEEVAGDDAIIVPENADPITNDAEEANPSDTSVGDDAYPQGTKPGVLQGEQAEERSEEIVIGPALTLEDDAIFEAASGSLTLIPYISNYDLRDTYKLSDWGSGCYTSCVTMVLQTLGKNVTPKDIWTLNGNTTYISSWSKIAATYDVEMSSQTKLNGSASNRQAAIRNVLKSLPETQQLLLVYVKPNCKENKTAHMVVMFLDDSDRLKIHDPGVKSGNSITIESTYMMGLYSSNDEKWENVTDYRIVKLRNPTPVTPTPTKTATYDSNNHIYECYDSSISWTDAKAFCESKGGHLVTINSKAENDWITNTLLKGCAKNIYFIGATDSGDNKWKWITGEAFAYTNWDADRPEPTNDSGEDYGAIMGKQVGNNKSPGEWIDIFNTGDTRYTGYSLSDCGFICEYESYTVTYNANGGTGAPGTQTKTHGVKLPLSSTKPSHANSSAGSYTVTLNANGGSVSKNSIDAARTTKYEFKTWNTKKDGSGTSYKPGADYTANAEVTLYAQWNTSTTTAAVTLPTPTREGYTFKGWGTSSSATSGVTGSYTPTGNVTLYAIWSVNKLTLQYHTNGGSIGTNSYDFSNDQDGYILRSGNRTVSTWRYGNTYEDGLVNNTTFGLSKPGYVFQGWRIGQGEDSIVYDQNLTLTPEKLCPELKNGDKTVTLYAVWEANKYTVTYNANGGAGAPGAQTKTQGTNLTLSSAKPTRASTSAGSYTVTLNANGGSVSPASLSAARTTSYTFKNWNTAANGSGTSYNPGATYSTDANVTLYAQWNSSTSTAAVTLPTPTRTGFIFKGWATSSSASSGVTGSYTPSGNVTLYAVWAGPDFVLPAALTTIDAEAFAGGAFSYVKLSEKTSTIQSRAFADCPNLRYVYIPEATTTIATDAFSGVSGLTIFGKADSYAEFFALRNGYAFVAAE